MIKDRIKKFCDAFQVETFDEAWILCEERHREAHRAFMFAERFLQEAKDLRRLRECRGCRHHIADRGPWSGRCGVFDRSFEWVEDPSGCCLDREER